MEKPFDFAAHEARMKQLGVRLASAPLVDLTGVLGALPPGGGRSPGETLWIMRFDLEAWRIGAGEVQLRRMTVRRAVTDEELEERQQRFEPFSIIRARARVVDDPEFARPEALLEEIVAFTDDDEQLKRHADRLRKPVSHEDPTFGTFVLDRRFDRFEGQIVWNGERVDVSVCRDAAGGITVGLSTLRHLWDDQRKWSERIEDYAVQELLDLKNDNWLDEDETPLTAEEFKDRMRLDRITIEQVESFTFWHDDGDLFWGHCIQVCGALRAGLTSADIAG